MLVCDAASERRIGSAKQGPCACRGVTCYPFNAGVCTAGSVSQGVPGATRPKPYRPKVSAAWRWLWRGLTDGYALCKHRASRQQDSCTGMRDGFNATCVPRRPDLL